jgi:hypothetical protein
LRPCSVFTDWRYTTIPKVIVSLFYISFDEDKRTGPEWFSGELIEGRGDQCPMSRGPLRRAIERASEHIWGGLPTRAKSWARLGQPSTARAHRALGQFFGPTRYKIILGRAQIPKPRHNTVQKHDGPKLVLCQTKHDTKKKPIYI